MGRDLQAYLQALAKHWVGLVGGAAVSVALIVWQYVFKKSDIPTLALWLGAVGGLFISAFQAWREQFNKVRLDPELAVMRPQFLAQLNMLNHQHLLALRYALSCGDLDPRRLHMLWQRHGLVGEMHDAQRRLAEIEQLTGFLQSDEAPRYVVNPVWKRLLYEEWAAKNKVEDFIPTTTRVA